MVPEIVTRVREQTVVAVEEAKAIMVDLSFLLVQVALV